MPGLENIKLWDLEKQLRGDELDPYYKVVFSDPETIDFFRKVPSIPTARRDIPVTIRAFEKKAVQGSL